MRDTVGRADAAAVRARLSDFMAFMERVRSGLMKHGDRDARHFCRRTEGVTSASPHAQTSLTTPLPTFGTSSLHKHHAHGLRGDRTVCATVVELIP